MWMRVCGASNLERALSRPVADFEIQQLLGINRLCLDMNVACSVGDVCVPGRR